jgi:hypothetical protein
MIITGMSSMAAVEQVQQRTKEQQNIRQELHDMSPMFLPEKISRDS